MDGVKSATELEDEVTKLAHTLDLEQVAAIDIDKGLELIQEVQKYVEQIEFAKRKRCIAVVGTTGVGKSTLVSLLFGEGKLLVHQENAFSRVLVAEKPLPGVDIHSGSSSKTLLPGVIRTSIGDEEVVVFDMPGNHDTRGPFAELVVHSIFKWMLAEHDEITFLLVATPPQNRPQGVDLATTINRVYDGSSNAVLVYMKCDADFEPGSTEVLEGIHPNKRKIPAFALMKPAKLDNEGQDYSSQYQGFRRAVLDRLVAPASPPLEMLAGSVPESVQLLLQSFCQRSIEKARDAISWEFLRIYNREYLRHSFNEASVLLDALANQQPLDFTAMVQLLQLMLPRVFPIQTRPSVVRSAKRMQLMERWSGNSLVFCKEEWLTEECRNILKEVESSLFTLREKISVFREVVKTRETKTLVIRAWYLQLSEQDAEDIKDFVGMMHTPHSQGIPSVILVGFLQVTIDFPLKVWANVVVVSPFVRISAIDLSAVGKAPACIPSCAEPGEDGKNGRPGLYGGNLIVVCQKLQNADNIVNCFKSSGQQGGGGQHAGRGVDGADAMYDVSHFMASAEKLAEQLSSLDKWEAAFKTLPGGIVFEKRSKEEIPPTDRDVVRAVVGAAVTTAAVAMSPIDPLVSAAGCVVGGGMVATSFGRKTRTKLRLVRLSEPGIRGIPPGRRGKGGHGGLGGEFFVYETGEGLVKWHGSGAAGTCGELGAMGTPSRDGMASVTVRGSIVLEYDSCGQRRGEPSISISQEIPREPRKLKQKAFTSEKRATPIPNPLLPVETAKTHYEEAFAQLVEEFPQCNFADIAMP